MEVTTMSPSAISPTEGHDLCETDVTNVAIHSVTLLIGLCGLAGNGAICPLSRKWRATSIFVMAAIDFVFLLFTVPSSLLFLLEEMSCSPIVSLAYMNFLFMLSLLPFYGWLSWVAYHSIRKDMTFFCSLCFRCNFNKRPLVWIGRSLALFAVLFFPPMIYLCPSHHQGYCRAALIPMFAVILLLVAAPVVISRTINIIKAERGSQQQLPKRHNIIIILIVLSTLPLSLYNYLQNLGYIVMSSQVVFLLACINSSIKPFICFLVGSSWRPCSMGTCWRHCTVGSLRDSLRRVLEEPEENTPSSNDASMDTVI